ncbi:methyltransferase domain-containing protein [Pseudoscourfieldia marina]
MNAANSAAVSTALLWEPCREGVCHKCAAPLTRVDTGRKCRMPGCGVKWHANDCGKHLKSIGIPPEMVGYCPRCSKCCGCGGGPLLCHATRLRQGRKGGLTKRKRASASGSANPYAEAQIVRHVAQVAMKAGIPPPPPHAPPHAPPPPQERKNGKAHAPHSAFHSSSQSVGRLTCPPSRHDDVVVTLAPATPAHSAGAVNSTADVLDLMQDDDDDERYTPVAVTESPAATIRDPLATQINSLQLPSNFTAANNTVNAASLALPVVSTTAPPALNVNVNTGNMGNGTMGSMVHQANLAAMLQTNMAAHLPPQFAAALLMMPPHILQALAQAAATMPQPPTLPAPPAAPARKTKQSSKFRSFEDARAYVRTLGLKSNEKWREWSKSGKRPHDIPSHPDVTYASSGWISYPDFLGYTDSQQARKTKQSSKFRSFEDARAYVRTLGLKSNEKWREWSKSGKRPHDIPSHPDVTYASSGWISYPDFLGYADSQQARKLRAVTGAYKRNAAAAGLWALQNDADNDEKDEHVEDDEDAQQLAQLVSILSSAKAANDAAVQHQQQQAQALMQAQASADLVSVLREIVRSDQTTSVRHLEHVLQGMMIARAKEAATPTDHATAFESVGTLESTGSGTYRPRKPSTKPRASTRCGCPRWW